MTIILDVKLQEGMYAVDGMMRRLGIFVRAL
jgi:hypothetical protein